MSLPYVLCPKCNQRNSSPQEDSYFQCASCGYLEPKGSIVIEDNKNYEEEREKLIEVREEELRKWDEEQIELAQRIVNHLIPKENVKVEQVNYLVGWGTSQITKSGNRWFPKTIYLPTKTLRTKEGKSVHGVIAGETGGSGFLPTTTHESSHCSYQVLKHPIYELFDLLGEYEDHNWVWRKVYEKFYQEGVKIFSKEIEERFKKLAEIKKEK